MTESIRIASVNCQGLSTLNKRIDVFEYYRTKNYNIICLQDTHFTEEEEKSISSQWGYDCFFNSFTSNARGVAILINNNFEFEFLKERKVKGGNILAVEINIEKVRFTLINIYGPNTDQPEFFDLIKEWIIEFENENFVICGDFNLVQNPTLDTFNYKNINHPKARKRLMQIMLDLNIIDYYRVIFPKKRSFTWRKRNPIKQARLDYFLIADQLQNITTNIFTQPSYRSDQSSVIIEFKLDTFTKGKGLWKFNNSLLKDKEYVEKVKQTIYRLKRQYAMCFYREDIVKDIANEDIHFNIDDLLFFETLMMEIRGLTISHASYKKKMTNKRELELENEINDLEIQDNFEETSTLLYDKKLELMSIRENKVRGTILRSKVKWIEEGEKTTTYFCLVWFGIIHYSAFSAAKAM